MAVRNKATGLSTKRLAVLTSLFCLAILAGMWVTAYHREQKSKVEWSILQSSEWKNRGNPNASNIILASEAGYHMVGVVMQDRPEALTPQPKADRVWILLDPHYAPYLKILAEEQAQFRITAEEIRFLNSYTKVNPEVDQELKKHLR